MVILEKLEHADDPALTFWLIEDISNWLDSIRKIYYRDDDFVPKLDEDGKEVMFRIRLFSGRNLWVMHPGILPLFLSVAERIGLTPIRYPEPNR